MPDTNYEYMINLLSDLELNALVDSIVHQYLVLPESWGPIPFLTNLYCQMREVHRLPAVVICPKRGASRRLLVVNLDANWLQNQYLLIVRSGGNVDSPAFDRCGFSALVKASRAEELARQLVKPLGENVSDNPPELGESKAPWLSRTGRCSHKRTSKR